MDDQTIMGQPEQAPAEGGDDLPPPNPGSPVPDAATTPDGDDDRPTAPNQAGG